jgi:hypothetical protein
MAFHFQFRKTGKPNVGTSFAKIAHGLYGTIGASWRHPLESSSPGWNCLRPTGERQCVRSKSSEFGTPEI